jgi:hypothetical protein
MIYYPLSFPPGLLGAATANLKKTELVGENIGEFDGSSELQQWQDQHWELDLEWPEMTWAQFAALDAFVAALHGKWGTFTWGPYWGAQPQGSPQGNPTMAAAPFNTARSNVLYTAGWTPSASGLLLPGDYVQLEGPSATVCPLQSTSEVGGIQVLVGLGVEVESGLLYLSLSELLSDTAANALIDEQVITYGLLKPGNLWLNGVPVTIASYFTGTGQNGATVTILISAPVSYPNQGMTYEPRNNGLLYQASPFRLHQYMGQMPLAADGGGNATLDIWPFIREVPNGNPLVVTNPVGTFRLRENPREAPARGTTNTFKFQMKCREAI